MDSLFWGSLSAESEDLELRVIMSHLYNCSQEIKILAFTYTLDAGRVPVLGLGS